MKKTVNILALLLVINNFVHGQSNRTITSINQISTIEETVFLHSNTTTFLCGEILFFKVYALNPNQKKFSTVSKIAYVELLDNENKSVMKHKISLKNGTGQGDFFIGTTLKTGNYKLAAYTSWTLNKGANGIHKTDIFIINPFESLPSEPNIKKQSSQTVQSDLSETAKKEDSTDANNSMISVKTDKSNYHTREKIVLTINSDSKNEIKGNFSVSVRKTDSLPYPEPATSVDFLNTAAIKDYANTEKSKYLPELRGEIISGKITAKESSKSVDDKTVSISMPGKHFAFKVAKTDESGKFNFILDAYPDTSNAVIQVMGKDRSDYAISLDETYIPDFKSLTVSNPLSLKPKNKDDIEKRSIANQIENNYYQKKKDSLTTAPKTAPFFHPLEKEYILDDYTRFPTLKETIVEVLAEVYYKRNKEAYSLHLRDNASQGEAYGEPLVMVDGLLIQDSNELFTYDTQDIFKVSLINQGYVYGPKVFNGVINFATKKNDYETKASGDFIRTVRLHRPQTKKKYFSPRYPEKDAVRIPDYRYQLFWEPEFSITEKETNLVFFSSDVKGQFQISLEGFTDSGKAVSLKEYITVE